MNKKYLREVIKNNERNKLLIDQIEKDFYSISSPSLTNLGAPVPESHDKIGDMIYKLDNNKHRINIQKKIDAVERLEKRLNRREKDIYILYFFKEKSIRAIECNGYSRSTIFRTIDNIYIKLEEELNIGEK